MCVRAAGLARCRRRRQGTSPGGDNWVQCNARYGSKLIGRHGRRKGSLACQTRPPGAASRSAPYRYPSPVPPECCCWPWLACLQCGTARPGCRNITGPDRRDPKAQVRPIPSLFPQDRSADRAATEPGHIRHEGGCGEARARGAVLQAPALARSPRSTLRPSSASPRDRWRSPRP